MPRESRHVWVGNLPEKVQEEEVAEYFSRYGRVEKIKLLPKISPDGGRAAFVDFVDIRSATKANEAQNSIGGRELRTNYNEPGHKHNNMNRDHGGFGGGHGGMHGGFPHPGMNFRHQPMGMYERIMQDRMFQQPLLDHGMGSRQTQRDGRRRSPGSALSDGDSDISEKDAKCTVGIRNILTREPDSVLEESIYHEFRKYGEIINIVIKADGHNRNASVQFAKAEQAEDATKSDGKMFMGQGIVVKVKGSSQSRGSIMDNLTFDPHATRTVFVGNLDKIVTHGELRNIFERFGEVVDVDIKKMHTGITTYSFVQFIDIFSATVAKRKMDRQLIANNRVKVGYGRGTPTNSLWIGNLSSKTVESELSKVFDAFGQVQQCLIDRNESQALIRYITIETCTKAFAEMHGKNLDGKHIAVDYASDACRNSFYNRMERHGCLDRQKLARSPTPPDAKVNYQNATQNSAPSQNNNNNNRFNNDRFAPDDYRNRSSPATMQRSSLSPSRRSTSVEYRSVSKRKLSSGGGGGSVDGGDAVVRKKEKKEKKKKKKKSFAEKRERKERKKAEKAKKKQEKKDKKLRKLEAKRKNMEAQLVVDQQQKQQEEEKSSSKADNPPPPSKEEELDESASNDNSGGISDVSQVAEPTTNNDNEQVVSELSDGEIAVADTKEEEEDVKPGDGENKEVEDLKRMDKKKQVEEDESSDSSDSSSSSSSSDSDSDDSSDDSSDDDSTSRKSNNHRSTKTSRQFSLNDDNNKGDRVEPKAYRKEPSPQRDVRLRGSREEGANREYSRSNRYSGGRSSSGKDEVNSPASSRRTESPSSYRGRDTSYDRRSSVRSRSPSRESPRYSRTESSSRSNSNNKTSSSSGGGGGGGASSAPPSRNDTLMDLLRRFPVMWQGLLGLKNETAAVQMHFLSGDLNLAEEALPHAARPNEVPPPLRISQRMKLEPSQLEGVEKRIEQQKEHCMLLALPCGRDPLDVHAQTRALKTAFIVYLQQKQAAGIINVPNSKQQPAYVVHIFPPCEFAQSHLVRVAPDLLDSAVDSGHLMVLITPV